MKHFLLTFLALVVCTMSFAQRDTVRITAKDINTNVLIEGTHRYLVYFKNTIDGPRNRVSFWNRTITRNADKTITIAQQWEDQDSISHTVRSVCKAEGLAPITHESWWRKRNRVVTDFNQRSVTVDGRSISAADTSKSVKAVWQAFETSKGKYFLNWHLDLETFPTFPFKQGRTFIVPYYDPGVAFPLQQVAYTVTGSEKITGYDNQQVDCWIMIHEEKGNKEKFWISKKTKEVLKLEQEINGKMWRYKIKLGFSV